MEVNTNQISLKTSITNKESDNLILHFIHHKKMVFLKEGIDH